MTSFDDLLTTPTSEIFKRVESLSPQEKHDLLVQNTERTLHSNRILEEEQAAALPREYRKQAGVRWDHFGYVGHYFTKEMMERQLVGHLAIEREDAKSMYMRNLLVMLVWMSLDHAAEADSDEVDASPKRNKKVKARRG